MINISIAIDDNYCMHACAMILSVIEYSGNETYKIYVFYSPSGLSKQNIASLKESVKHSNCLLVFIKLNDNLFSKQDSTLGLISKAAYYRIASFDVIPEKRVLYLDVDTIVMTNLKELFNFNLQDFPIGAVQDYVLGLFDKTAYFNSGVLLVDLEKWKKEAYSEKVLRYIKANNGKLVYPDQDALNQILKDNWLQLPLKYNRQKIIHELNEGDLGIKKALREQLIHHPSIIHYTGVIKPWHFRYVFPDKAEYVRYIEKTKWSNDLDKDFSLKSIIFFVFRYMTYKTMMRRRFEYPLIFIYKLLR
jgi:lipopolysaccharide biosynthesis glycosyltransferase